MKRDFKILLFSIMAIFVRFTYAGTPDSADSNQATAGETIGNIYENFKRLDRDNAYDSEYANFKWTSWKLAVVFVNPSLTKDSFNYNSRIFLDLYPNESYWNFLTEEIANIWLKNTDFFAVEWMSIPLKQRLEKIEYRNDTYDVILPDSPKETFHNTGCRFVLLLQHFSQEIKVTGSKEMTLIYQNVAPQASRGENYAHLFMLYSCAYTYVLYDLMEERVVQFGKAFDSNKDQNTKASDIKHCLDDALMDVIEVSKFYRN